MLHLKCAASNLLGRSPLLKTMSVPIRRYAAPGQGIILDNKRKYVPTSGTYPKGFLAGSACAGVKPSNHDRKDVAIIISKVPASAAAVFTRNIFQAAPVTISRQTLSDRAGQGISGVVVNSGCANAVTGKDGLEDAKKMCKQLDKCLDDAVKDDGNSLKTLVMSTGVIGQRCASVRTSICDTMCMSLTISYQPPNRQDSIKDTRSMLKCWLNS